MCFESIIIQQTTQSCRIALPLSHLDLDCGAMLRCVCLFESFLTRHKCGSHNQAAKCGKSNVNEFSIVPWKYALLMS